MAEKTSARSPLWLLVAVAWLVPGGGHLWLGRRKRKQASFEPQAEPLVTLAAIADVGIGLPNLIARALGLGAGDVTAITWEYGNTFTIVAGLLNMLVVLDAVDVAEGRK